MPEELAIPGYLLARLYDEVPSTMDVARGLLSEVGEGQAVVCARRQLSGRGRQGRSWSSTEGSLMATFVLHSGRPVAAFSGYSLAVGAVLADIFRTYGAPVMVKWPNDLVALRDGELCKVGGILIEVQEKSDGRSLLVGVGINVSTSPDDVGRATSIRELSAKPLSLSEALYVVADGLNSMHLRFEQEGGFKAFRPRWEELTCFQKGSTRLTIDLGETQISGTYFGIDETGSLQLDSGSNVRSLHSGHLLRVDGVRGV